MKKQKLRESDQMSREVSGNSVMAGNANTS